jgi:predicted Zn-dependent peptidase
LAKIDFADLIFTKQRLLNADNATLAISGDVQSSYAYRAARRLLGGWQKSQKKIPANFRLPAEPDKNLSIIPTSAENVSELRFAAKGVARNDDAYFANLILARVLEHRMASNAKNSVTVEESFLPGYILYNFSDWNVKTVKMIGQIIPLPGDIDSEVSSLLSNKITDAEFAKAKTDVIGKFEKISVADLYFDIVTYRLKSVKDELKSLQKVTLADVNQVADEWRKETLVKVLVVSKVEEPKEVKEPEETIEQSPDPNDPNRK